MKSAEMERLAETLGKGLGGGRDLPEGFARVRHDAEKNELVIQVGRVILRVAPDGALVNRMVDMTPKFVVERYSTAAGCRGERRPTA